jgi:23S rRNA (adenine2503-C2)-methyltransferase
MNHDLGLRIGARKITISTAGIIPAIDRLAGEGLQVKLAISLNAASDELRNWLIPLNRRYPLFTLMKAAKRFADKTGKRITFEYVLIDGVNDSLRDARDLAGLVDGIPCKVNLIPFNRHAGTKFRAPAAARIEAFKNRLLPSCPAVTLRASRGRDIGAACGQLSTNRETGAQYPKGPARPSTRRRSRRSRPREKK